jgi:AAA+ superfamily predicted ATPase
MQALITLPDLAATIRHRLTSFFQPSASENGQWHFSEESQHEQLKATLGLPSMTPQENLLLLLALAPHVQPQFLDQTIQESLPQPGDFPQLGGVRGKHFRGFLPTGETALFLLAGEDLELRMEVQRMFSEEHFFAKKHILWLEEVQDEPRMSGRIILSQEYVDLLTIGKVAKPRFSLSFPAQLLETEMEWDDLVLNDETLAQIHELEAWIKHTHILMDNWGMRRKLKPGYRVLFHGPPGTGKTLTATLLGKYTGKDVYKIDLSMVVSKFIGETEKNLASLFAKAESKDWILFFDEADALFSKRTNVKDAHDKYANQEVSYLLQRVENYDGLVILATNFKSNLDDAFIRRFQSIMHFLVPKASERLLIWQKAFPKKASLSSKIHLSEIAHKYELSGAEIMNVVQYCCLQALAKDTDNPLITETDLTESIRREFQKGGKLLR